MLYEKAGYSGVFGLGVGILAVDFIMRLLIIEKKVASRYDSSVISNTDANAGNDQDSSDETADEAQSASESSSLLDKQEDDYYTVPPSQPSWLTKFPLLYCFKDPSLLTALLVALVQATLLATFDATVATEAQSLFDFDSLSAGLLFIPLGLGDLIFGPLSGWAVDRYGTKPAATIGYSVLIPILISLRAVHAGGKDMIILYCALLTLCGIGLAIVGAPSIVEAGAVVQKYHKANPDFFGQNGPYAQLYGINSMVFSAGLTLGPLIAGGLRDAIGYGNMNAVVAGVCAVTAVVSWVYIGGKPRLLRKKRYRRY